MTRLYDTHFHLDLQPDRLSSIREIEKNQIYTIAVTNLPDLYRKETIEIASKYIRFGLGFHPELIHEYKNQIPLMWDLLPEVRYIGEVGLDFVDITYQQEQIIFFQELIERCRHDSKIITIHSRKAVGQVLDIIGNNFNFIPILHWFTGNKKELVDAIDKGFYFSINEAMMNSKKFLSLLPLIPKDQILLETDSPFIKFDITHSNTLANTIQSIKTIKKNIDLWNNFRRILENQ